jgi:hypothetical protein
MNDLGRNIWIFPDAFLPAKGEVYKTTNHGNQYSHESLCIVNCNTKIAKLDISFLFEDKDPIKNYMLEILPERSLHLRLDKIVINGKIMIPRETAYSIILSSNLKIVAQLSRLDTTSNYNSFMTVIGWGENV